MVSWTEPQLTEQAGTGHARIKVCGVGGGGVNVVRRMAALDIPGVELLCVNTDTSSLSKVHDIPCLGIGAQMTRGMGSGGNPEIGKRAAQESREDLRKFLEGGDLVFIAAGMGGGTGTGAAPVIADMARELGALTIAVVTTPFSFEGLRRRGVAEAGLKPLRETADTVIIVSNNRLLSTTNRKTSVSESFSRADKVMQDAIAAVARIINVPGDINIDFADVRTVVSRGGAGVMSIGIGEGSQRVLKAAQAAFDNPLMERGMQGAKGLVFTVTGGPDVTLSELNEAGTLISSVTDADAEIFFGMHIDNALKPGAPAEMVIIATRLPENPNDGEPDPAKSVAADKVQRAAARYYAEDDLPAFLKGVQFNFDGPGWIKPSDGAER